MDDNKLYNALLKSQETQRQLAFRHGEARAEDNFRKERPFASSERQNPNWIRIEAADEDNPPTLYDSSVSLGLIANPNPLSRDQLRERKVIYSGMADKEVLDAYRELRIQLRNRSLGDGFSVLISSLESRGNSLLAAFNLSAAFAMDSNISALLVDCDPYQDELSSLVSSKLRAGVTDFVADPSLSITDILYSSGVDRLSVIPAGTQASSAVELFASGRMKELMTELKGRYPDRCIVINAPPMRCSTEARILERFADQIVFTIPFGEVSGDELAEAVTNLDSEKLSGVVFQE